MTATGTPEHLSPSKHILAQSCSSRNLAHRESYSFDPDTATARSKARVSSFHAPVWQDLSMQEGFKCVANNLSKRIRSELARIRGTCVKCDDGPSHSAVLTDRVSHICRAVIGIPTKGCSCATTAWGGCAVCGHLSSTLWQPSITTEAILSDVRLSLAAVAGRYPDTLCLYTSGSFLDADELDPDVRSSILRLVSSMPYVKTVAIESSPQFVTPEALDDVLSVIPNKSLTIGLGIDSTHDFVRHVLFQRHTTIHQYADAVSLCLQRSIPVTAYVVLGNPLLPRDAAVADTAQSVSDAFQMGATVVSIEPVALQPSTLQFALWQAGVFQIPSIWDVAAVVQRCEDAVKSPRHRLVLGGQVFTPLPIESLHSCSSCLARATKWACFDDALFWNSIPTTSHGRCCTASPPCPSHTIAPKDLVTHISGVLDRLPESFLFPSNAATACSMLEETIDGRD